MSLSHQAQGTFGLEFHGEAVGAVFRPVLFHPMLLPLLTVFKQPTLSKSQVPRCATRSAFSFSSLVCARLSSTPYAVLPSPIACTVRTVVPLILVVGKLRELVRFYDGAAISYQVQRLQRTLLRLFERLSVSADFEQTKQGCLRPLCVPKPLQMYSCTSNG